MKAATIAPEAEERRRKTRKDRTVARDTATDAPLFAAILEKFQPLPSYLRHTAQEVVRYAGNPEGQLYKFSRLSRGRILKRAKRNNVRLNESLVLLALLQDSEVHTIRERSPLAGRGFYHVSLSYIANAVEVLTGRRLSISAIDRIRQTLKHGEIMEPAKDPLISPATRRKVTRTRRKVTRKGRRVVRDTANDAPILAAVLGKFRNLAPEIRDVADKVAAYAGNPQAIPKLGTCAGDRDNRKRAKRNEVRLNESLVLLALLLQDSAAHTSRKDSPLDGVGFVPVPMVWLGDRVAELSGVRLSVRGLSRVVRTLKAAGIYG